MASSDFDQDDPTLAELGEKMLAETLERSAARRRIEASFREAAEEAIREWGAAITREREELLGEFPNHSFCAVFRPDGTVSLVNDRIGSYTVPASLRISANGKRLWPKP